MNNIKKIRKQKGLTITELASQIGMSQANLTKIENNQIELKTEIAKKIADTLNVSLSAIQNNEELKGIELINPEAYQLPNLSSWNIPPQINIDSKTSKAYILADDTMSPTIKEYSICIVDTSNTTLNNGIFLIKYNNSLLIRRLQITPNNLILLLTDNKSYCSQEANPESFAIIGKVTHITTTAAL